MASSADLDGDGKLDMAEALGLLSAQSLRNAEVAAIRAGAEAEAEAAAATATAPGPAPADAPAAPTEQPAAPMDDEPIVKSRDDRTDWRKWATTKAREYADTVHPRLVHKDRRVTKLPIMAKPNDVLAQVGIVPALYLDFLKFGAGFCLLGLVLTAIPGIVLGILHAEETFKPSILGVYPSILLRLSIGARSRCEEDICKTMNTLSAAMEVIYSLLLFWGTLSFRRRVADLAAINDANNVYTREYAVQLHGMPRDATPQEVQAHVESILASEAKLGAEQVKVWDVALMANSSTVLRQAVKQAPLERKWTILKKKLDTLMAFQEAATEGRGGKKGKRDVGWGATQKIAEVRDDAEATGSKLLSVRARIEKRGFTTCGEVVGAFVVFEEQPARNAFLKLYGGGVTKWMLQKKHLRYRDPKKAQQPPRRLKAYAAPQPRDLLHENLPYRINALGVRGLSTLVRRLISTALLMSFLLVSFGMIAVVNSLKADLTEQIQILERQGRLDLLPNSVRGLLDALVPQLPALASAVVAGVNLAIQALVGFLGNFERHPTLSNMHKNKAITIFLAQAFNTGILPLIVFMAPPPAAFMSVAGNRTAYADACNCGGLFCCILGPTGALMRGQHVTMWAGWHEDVGSLLISSLVIQALLATVLWAAPMVVHLLKRAIKAASVMHRYDMEALYEGPPIDLPKFIGKAYAFYFVSISFAAVLPVLYAVGIVFFFASWVTQRYAYAIRLLTD